MLRFPIRYFLSLFIVLSFVSFANSATIPKPVGYINDFAHILNKKTKEKLDRLALELKQKTGVELVIVTIDSIKGEDIFDYSMDMFEKWGIGQKGKDNGLLFLVDIKDKKLRINTGYGLEGILPDGLLGRIRDNYIIPYFKKGNYDAGILNGTMAIAAVIAKAYNINLNGFVNPQPVKNKGLSMLDIVLMIAAMFVLGPYLFPFFVGMFLGSYRSGWESPLGGGFGGGLGGGFGGFGGGSSGGGGIGGSW